ncbi:hypothetical protein JIN85_18420 [Luteolibacter pohnpeiensis]|uniref:Uncharacterized protein n=1 Tax=Luteolibacter pohnpeiensis TaxID=454153 RepID=A0A934SAP8_9BACT|nr:hypothetical protein [Luteolibacter pohnpeiensis]MBK1884399.1 hypothetical protein [Luteolibacter pohnpeiensis]
MAEKHVRFSAKIATEILSRLSDGESLRSICRDVGMPAARSVLRWAEEDVQGFRAKYERARECQAHALFDEMLETAGSAQSVATGAPGTGEASAKVQAVKLKVDALKWYIARVAPKSYGDKMALEHSGPGGGPMRTETEHHFTEEDEKVVERIREAREKVKVQQSSEQG